MVIDCPNRTSDHRKASLNSDNFCQYLDVTTTFTNFNFLQVFLKHYLSYFELANQDKNIAQAIRNMVLDWCCP